MMKHDSEVEVAVNVLGISGSPRRGNSLYLLEQAVAGLDDIPPIPGVKVTAEIHPLAGKRISPCLACGSCRAAPGACVLDDDFAELFARWVAADVVLYSAPVYHLGVPAQLKAFFDRLGNTVRHYHGLESPRHLKTVGALVQGQHYYAGEELALTSILQHAVLLNCVPVPGDRWGSYLGAVGWTENRAERTAMADLDAAGDPYAKLTIKAARDVARRAVELAAILKLGARALEGRLSQDQDRCYLPVLRRLDPRGE